MDDHYDMRHWRFARTSQNFHAIEDCTPPSRRRWLTAAVLCAVIVGLVVQL